LNENCPPGWRTADVTSLADDCGDRQCGGQQTVQSFPVGRSAVVAEAPDAIAPERDGFSGAGTAVFVLPGCLALLARFPWLPVT